jgi:hypothetical protein
MSGSKLERVLIRQRWPLRIVSSPSPIVCRHRPVRIGNVVQAVVCVHLVVHGEVDAPMRKNKKPETLTTRHRLCREVAPMGDWPLTNSVVRM